MRNLEPSEIAQKVKLLLDSSGDKLKLEKGHPVKSTTESVRGEESSRPVHMMTFLVLTLFFSSARRLVTIPHAVERCREYGQDQVAVYPTICSCYPHGVVIRNLVALVYQHQYQIQVSSPDTSPPVHTVCRTLAQYPSRRSMN